VQGYPGDRFDLDAEGPLGQLEPPLRLLEPSLANHRSAELDVGDAGDRLLAPAVPPGQLDRLQASLRAQRKGVNNRDLREVAEAGELEIGPPDLTGQRHALLQMAFGLLVAECPGLGFAEADQRERAPLLAHPKLGPVRDPGRG
jgi:hypothetical protein